VDGDPVADISVLENRRRFLAVIQGGIIKAGQLAGKVMDEDGVPLRHGREEALR
jgi:hypothetical protein